jgi:hypothetical protein
MRVLMLCGVVVCLYSQGSFAGESGRQVALWDHGRAIHPGDSESDTLAQACEDALTRVRFFKCSADCFYDAPMLVRRALVIDVRYASPRDFEVAPVDAVGAQVPRVTEAAKAVVRLLCRVRSMEADAKEYAVEAHTYDVRGNPDVLGGRIPVGTLASIFRAYHLTVPKVSRDPRKK